MKIERTGEQLGVAKVLSKAGGLEKLLVWEERLPPGRRSSSPHRHTSKEEMIVVAKGVLTVQHGPRMFTLKPGEAVAFQPGDPLPHVVRNDTATDVIFLGIAINDGSDEVIYAE